MNNLVYVAYGHGPHVDELLFSVLSARFASPGRSGGVDRVVVYTDAPEAMAGWGIEVEPLTKELLTDWSGPSAHLHRPKLVAIRHALAKYRGRVLFCDSDTYFSREPAKVFARIRPGHTVMHLGEYRLQDGCARPLANLMQGRTYSDSAGRGWRLSGDVAMFNGGVVGVHESDLPLLDEALHLNDQIYPAGGLPTPDDPRRYAEQFALSICFQQRTTLHQAHDVICHYWAPSDRVRFREPLVRVLHEESGTTPEERFRRLWPHRPGQDVRVRPFKGPVAARLGTRIHHFAWRVAKATGILAPLKALAMRVGFRSH